MGNDGALPERAIGCAIDVHRALGPGLFEAVYEIACVVRSSRARFPIHARSLWLLFTNRCGLCLIDSAD